MYKQLRKFFEDSKGHVVITQMPNLPLIGFLVFSLIGAIFNKGEASYFIKALAYGSLFTWCYLEIFFGVSLFRRSLGLVVLIGSTLSITSYLSYIISN